MPRINPPTTKTPDATAVAEAEPQADALFGDDPFGGAMSALFSSPRREAIPDLSTVPPMVKDFFAARGYRVTLASGAPASVQVLSTHQRFPLNLDEIVKPDIREEIKSTLVKYGFRVDQSGFPMRGDCMLFVQSEQAREAQLARGRMIYQHQDDPASLDEALTDINQRFSATGLNRTYTQRTDVSRLQDHVTPWQEE